MEKILIELFSGWSTPLLLLVIAVAIYLLGKGADWLVESAVAFAEKLSVPKVVIGATIVSLGTTTPEAAVSVMAAFKGQPDFALGNSVGSIICDTGLIFGLACVLVRLPHDRFVLQRHGWLQFASGVLLVVASLLFRNEEGARVIPQWMGYVFMLLLAAYLVISVFWAKQHDSESHASDDVKDHTEEPLWRHGIFLGVGLLMVLFGSQMMIADVEVLCHRFSVPPAIVAANLIAFGTSLPELVTAITCIRKKHTELLVGNIIGADILNVLFVTGAAAVASELTVEPLFLQLHFPVMILVLLIFRITASLSKDSFPRWPGAVLLAIFVIYLAINVHLAQGESAEHASSETHVEKTESEH